MAVFAVVNALRERLRVASEALQARLPSAPERSPQARPNQHRTKTRKPPEGPVSDAKSTTYPNPELEPYDFA